MEIISSKGLYRCAIMIAIVSIAGCRMMHMPGKSYCDALPSFDSGQARYQEELKHDVATLADEIGERNVFNPEALARAARHIKQQFENAGYTVREQAYAVRDVECLNIEAERRGSERPHEIIVVGGHYDAVFGSPAANDNATGTAAVLALARVFKNRHVARTIRFVAFVNEEPPFFQTAEMGSLVYAKACKKNRDNVVAMLSLETMGHFSDAENSQNYPFPFGLFYPSTGNFIAFVGNVSSGSLVRDCVRSFRAHASFPSEGAAIPSTVPGVGWSDHWAFWEQGYKALMITDTAPFRYAHYHTTEDTVDKIDFASFARVVAGVEHVIMDLVNP